MDTYQHPGILWKLPPHKKKGYKIKRKKGHNKRKDKDNGIQTPIGLQR